ncbi:MAG: hypothetical protein ACXWFJ_10355, partial [Candidatus Aminicenantales bacterium]
MRQPERGLVAAFVASAAFSLIAFSAVPLAADPPRYGYLVQNGPKCTVWWAEGAYKVMRDDPVPAA